MMTTNWYRIKSNSARNRKSGDAGQRSEIFARTFLEDQGLKILDTNFRIRLGEIDIIAQDCEDLVFTEVRFRSGTSHGGARESVSIKKRQRLIKAAQVWLQKNPLYQNHYCRFDLIAIERLIDIEHTTWEKNAFQLE